MSIISMQINKGQPTSICADCHVEVTNDYVGHKEHVIKRHIGGHTEGDRAAFISKFIQFCFPGSLVINDLQVLNHIFSFLQWHILKYIRKYGEGGDKTKNRSSNFANLKC